MQAAGIDLGVLEILERADDEDAVAHLGPDLLGDDWDPHVAAANLVADPDRPLAEALLDQRVMAGVGNVYCNELCFVFGHLPTTPVGDVKDPLRMVQRARDMLWLNRSRVESHDHRRYPARPRAVGLRPGRASHVAAAAPPIDDRTAEPDRPAVLDCLAARACQRSA